MYLLKLLSLLGIAVVLVGCNGGPDIASRTAEPGPLDRDEAAFLHAMKPHRPRKPVVVVLARNEATETTDFLLTHSVLQRSGIVELHAIAPKRGRVSLYPVLDVEVQEDFADFDRAYPAGADYVIVPAMQYEKNGDPAVTSWLGKQASLGARIIGVCAGALVAGSAGILDDRRATTHWYFLDKLLERHPRVTYVPNRRYVVDGSVATTTGITASVPTMLALVEAIGGRARAAELANELGVPSWGPEHDSSAFGLTLPRATRYLLAKAAFWRDETAAIDVGDGVDDVALALVADAWSRTGHVAVEAASPSGPVKLRSGLTLLARPVSPGIRRLSLDASRKPVQQLDRTLEEIEAYFGRPRRQWVQMELEYPGVMNP